MNKKTSLVIIFLLLVAAFLAGSTAAKIKYLEGESKPIAGSVTAPVANNPTLPPFEAKKSAKPEVKFFVMSFCPFGNQAEAGLEPVYQLLKNKVSWLPRYIVNDKKKSCEQSCPFRVYDEKKCQDLVEAKRVPDMDTCKNYFPYQSANECLSKECFKLKAGEYASLHGDQELNQDVREICAYNLGDLGKWWKFVSLVNNKCTDQNADTCWLDPAKEAGLNTGKIESCFKNQKAALLAKDLAESEKYQASGSPTVYINDVLYNGGRAPEDYKKAICASFENPPKECSTVLGQESAATTGGCQ